MADSKKLQKSDERPAPTKPKHPRVRQQRSEATRRELIEAARRIFARDGFELARLEDIAAAAKKTRGAFYQHFKDKEDVFFAIFEEDLRRDKARLRRKLEAVSSRKDRIDAVARHMTTVLRDRRRMLLNLEFKLYAIRHPKRQRRLAALHAEMCLSCADARIEDLLPELKNTSPARRRSRSAEFSALIDGVALSRSFDPVAFNESQAQRHLRAGVESILQTPAR